MSTATINQSPLTAASHTLAIFWRFVWKEFRMLRGFWLAVGVLAILQQMITQFLTAPGEDLSGFLFASALGAAALYACGATATMFAVEHEEETYNYISNLPTTWQPVFWGKLLVATIGALALALVLCVVAWLVVGHAPRQQEVLDFSGAIGVAMLEALAWGTCFSLILKRPLAAALFSIVAASASVHLIVNFATYSVAASWQLESYTAVIGWRLAVVATIMAANVFLARRWWPKNMSRSISVYGTAEGQGNLIDSTISRMKVNQLTKKLATMFNAPAKSEARIGRFAGRAWKPSRLRMIGRLLWQSWRNSRGQMLLMLFATITVGLAMGGILIEVTKHFIPWGEFPWLISLTFCLFGSAIFASSVFSADQRREQYRFLAEHAGRPRYVWLCRLAVWFSGFGAILLFGLVVLSVFTGETINTIAMRQAHQWLNASGASQWDLEKAVVQWAEVNMAVRSIVAGLLGLVTGLAIGQFSSLVMRRSLVAGLLAGVLAVAMIGWSAVVIVWELPWIVFLLPVPLGFFLASWLRAPDWITGRNNVRGWAKVLLAVAMPMAAVVGLIPSTRLENVPGEIPGPGNLKVWLERVDVENTPEAHRVGDELLRLSQEIERFVSIDIGIKNEEGKAELTHEQILEMYRRKTSKNRDVIDQAIALSKNRAGRFPAWTPAQDFAQVYQKGHWLTQLLDQAGEVATSDGDLDSALKHYLASMRITGFLRAGQQTSVYFFNTMAERQLWEKLVQWAAHEEQTSKRVLEAINELEQIYPSQSGMNHDGADDSDYVPPSPIEAIIADYDYLRDVLNEKILPSYLGDNAYKTTGYLAYLANKLPFERKRALWMLYLLSLENLEQVTRVQSMLSVNQRHNRIVSQQLPLSQEQRQFALTNSASRFRQSLRKAARQNDRLWSYRDQVIVNSPPWSRIQTSYLLRNEYQYTTNFGMFLRMLADTGVRQLALKVRLAMIAYRIDHDEYPDALDALVPDYLSQVPIDPYAGLPLGYEPTGLPGKLKFHSAYTGGDTLEPRTPFIWSVGANNGYWVTTPADVRDSLGDEGGEGEGYAEESGEGEGQENADFHEPEHFESMEYKFAYQDRGATWPDDLVFALPK